MTIKQMRSILDTRLIMSNPDYIFQIIYEMMTKNTLNIKSISFSSYIVS